ncbi:hypothetical protein G6F52_012314 [Rhizopus delemar]|nr:hypothetical protein G6F52_012314 [Rhizopus delemar]
MDYLRTVFLQDSVVLKEKYPENFIWSHSIFETDLYKDYEERLSAAIAANDEKFKMSQHLEVLLTEVAAAMKTGFDSMNAMMNIVQSQNQLTLDAKEEEEEGIQNDDTEEEEDARYASELSLSNILSFANPQLRDVYQSIIPAEEMKNINYSRQQKKMELAFDNEMNSVIDGVLDKLKLDTITTTNTDTLHIMIDELKHKESDKRSSNYQVLNVVEMVTYITWFLLPRNHPKSTSNTSGRHPFLSLPEQCGIAFSFTRSLTAMRSRNVVLCPPPPADYASLMLTPSPTLWPTVPVNGQ